MFYTKKPIKVEAVVVSAAAKAILTGDFEGVPAFVPQSHSKGLFRVVDNPNHTADPENPGPNDSNILINSDNGVVTANPTDMLIHGVNGEVYPCSASAFAKSYDAVSEGVDEEGLKKVSDGA